MDQPAGTAGANRRIAMALFVAVIALLVLPCVLVVRPWQRYGVPLTVIAVVTGVGLVGLFCALLYRSAENRPDWNHARVATELTDRGTVIVTITCTDLIPRATFRSLTQDLRTAFEQPGHDGIVLTVEPLEGREHVLHLETTPPRLEAAMRVLRDEFARHGIARIGPSTSQ
ncbi:hypothetical protein [Actinoplanes sichuanensis]|uniref:Uncharacterized protein n=1 Tax=Actinoplanes sichuanensis TaxID=512349 RepID=A0ABW4A1C4_9ACTN|nr:hypothetical protein [Actinoplanes sichuanensis]